MTTIERQVSDVKHRMFTDAEVQAAQPNIPLATLRQRLEQVGFDLQRLRRECNTATYRPFETHPDLQGEDGKRLEDEVTWPDGTVQRWAAMARPLP